MKVFIDRSFFYFEKTLTVWMNLEWKLIELLLLNFKVMLTSYIKNVFDNKKANMGNLLAKNSNQVIDLKYLDSGVQRTSIIIDLKYFSKIAVFVAWVLHWPTFKLQHSSWLLLGVQIFAKTNFREFGPNSRKFIFAKNPKSLIRESLYLQNNCQTRNWLIINKKALSKCFLHKFK